MVVYKNGNLCMVVSTLFCLLPSHIVKLVATTT